MKFLEFLNEGINDRGIFKAIFMCGQACSGKTYAISKIQDGQIGAKIVNTDKFLEYYNFSKNVPADLDKVKLLTKEQLALYLNSILPLFIDSTSTNPNALIRRKGIIESLGYDTGLIFVNASLETSLKRLQQRSRKVPEELIKQKYQEVQDLIPFYQSKFDWYSEIDNDDGELNDEAILKAYRKTSGFFTSSINSPLGQKIVDKMRENKWKYLSDGIYNMDYIKRLVDVWYKH